MMFTTIDSDFNPLDRFIYVFNTLCAIKFVMWDLWRN